ncbi:hypothetical protein MTP99_009092 [Tenebrio molitor]|nr:hypothetical protein MTP99_009092 [Tenebrio molitor]
MSRDEVHIRDRLLLLAECSNPHKPFNVKRKSTLTKQGSKSGPKLSVQDFVRMDPGYTPDIEHLVFPARKRNPQQVAPLNPPSGKTRSRLAEMFALSRHLQQRSADRDSKTRNPTVNRSVDSVMEPRSGVSAAPPAGTRSTDTSRRWVSAAEEPVRQNSNTTRISPAAESDMAAARGPNVSVLHLRNTSEPWETTPSSVYTTTSATTRAYPTKTVPTLTKHQSLSGPYKWANSSNFHSVSEVNNSAELFIGSTCNRELSPVRWCDREVDGVYLGRSGWVQVQQRSLDENRRCNYATTSSLQTARRTGIKLADYHCNSEPGKCPEVQKVPEANRPAYLSLQGREFDRKKSPSPQPESFSPPPVTPIISPPPAFQDKNKKTLPKTKTFFGKTPFLPRSNAIDSDEISPPPSPKPVKWKSMSMPTQTRRVNPPPVPVIPEPKGFGRIPQTKSLEDTTATRRSLFVQRYGESSSSSSSSMGFRSLDSCVNRPAMPRLSENTDSSVDVYEDADEEDNNSSSINISMVNMNMLGDFNRPKEKISPSSRPNRLQHHRGQLRKVPTLVETSKPPNCASPGSSSSSSNEFPSRSPMGSTQQIRRITPSRLYQPIKISQEDPSLQRVRRSRSLQLPDKKAPQNYRESLRISPQHPETHRPNIKMGTQVTTKRPNKPIETSFTEEDLLREAEVVTSFLYGNRTRAAAQALLMHRYNNSMAKEEKPKELPKPPNNGLTVYFVGNPKKDRPKMLHRGSTTPNLPIAKHVFGPQVEPNKNPCNPDTCDFWPHCAHRESLNREAQFHMRSSQSYPTHQRSLDSTSTKRGDVPRRVSPNKAVIVPKRETDFEKKTSPVSVPFGTVSSSSSSSDVWLTTSDRTISKSPKNAKSSGGSTPLEDLPPLADNKSREMILTRPGSAPTEERNAGFLESQQRSMSLPKSFLSVSHQQGSSFYLIIKCELVQERAAREKFMEFILGVEQNLISTNVNENDTKATPNMPLII